MVVGGPVVVAQVEESVAGAVWAAVRMAGVVEVEVVVVVAVATDWMHKTALSEGANTFEQQAAYQ